MGKFETQEAFLDSQLLVGSQNEAQPEQHTQHEDAGPAKAQQEPVSNGARFQHFLHAFNELFRESERFHASVRPASPEANQSAQALKDVLRNHRTILDDLEEQMQHVWVQVNLDASGSLHFGSLMRVETTVQSLYQQLPPLFQHVLRTLPQDAHLQFRLLQPNGGHNSEPFDLECSRSISLQDIMVDYLPGTFEFKFQLICNSEPLDVQQQLLEMAQPQVAPSSPSVRMIPVSDHNGQNSPAKAQQGSPGRSLPPMHPPRMLLDHPHHPQQPVWASPSSIAAAPAAAPAHAAGPTFDFGGLEAVPELGLRNWDRLAAHYNGRQTLATPRSPSQSPAQSLSPSRRASSRLGAATATALRGSQLHCSPPAVPPYDPHHTTQKRGQSHSPLPQCRMRSSPNSNAHAPGHNSPLGAWAQPGRGSPSGAGGGGRRRGGDFAELSGVEGSAGGFRGLSYANEDSSAASLGHTHAPHAQSGEENIASGHNTGAPTPDLFQSAGGSSRARKRQRAASPSSPGSPPGNPSAGPSKDAASQRNQRQQERHANATSPARGSSRGRPTTNPPNNTNTTDSPIGVTDLINADDARAAARRPRAGRLPRLPESLARAPVGPPGANTPSRTQWGVEDVTVLLNGIQEYGKQWSMIQLVHFPSRPGTAFQNKIKDKWRVLCKGVKNRNSARSNLPAHLWDRVETLSKLYSILTTTISKLYRVL